MKPIRRAIGNGGPALAVLAAMLMGGPALGQSFETRAVSVSPAVVPPPPPWSGEAGASGHPLMTVEAIRSAAANFRACLEQTWPEAARRGVSRRSFDLHTAGLEPDLRIMDLLDSQPEFTKSIWDYLDILVSDARIASGQEMLARNRDVFDRVEKAYGVDRHILAAIWGVETNFGAIAGDRPVIRSTATLACVGRRQEYFREEFLSTLEILHANDVRPDLLRGSWAGAFGPTQFMPTTFKRYAVDFNGDGRRDVMETLADVMASTANNLHRDGWAVGQGWGYEVMLPIGFDYRLADRSRQMTLREWEALGARRTGGGGFPRPSDRAYLLLPAGARGPGFLMLANFRVIMKYNPAEAYALAIGHLADRLRGLGPFVQPWPRDERVLSRAERLEMQQRLAAFGFAVGEPDGRIGPRTRAALREFQTRAGLIPDGFASVDVLNRMRTP